MRLSLHRELRSEGGHRQAPSRSSKRFTRQLALVVNCLLGRDDLLEHIRDLLSHGHNVLLFGPADVGKSAIIRDLGADGVTARVSIIDPFSRITPRQAAEVRRAMDLRGAQYLAATRSLDRRELGAVRRIVWRFTNLRVPPLPDRLIRRLMVDPSADLGVDRREIPDAWAKTAAPLASGCPGVALSMVRAAVELFSANGTLPSANLAYVVARMNGARFGGENQRQSRVDSGDE